MNVQQVKDYCRQCVGAEERQVGHPYNILSYGIDGKKFAYFKTSQPQQWRFSVRVSAEQFVELTDNANINPARYMGRFHWITIIDVKQIDAEYLQQLIQDSYTRALRSLSKKRQAELQRSTDLKQ